jgi:hypothetical protein
MSNFRLETPVVITCLATGAGLLIGTLAFSPASTREDVRLFFSLFAWAVGTALVLAGLLGSRRPTGKGG